MDEPVSMDDITWRTITSYLADECSPDEASEVEAWMDRHPSRRRVMAELRQIWQASAWSAPDQDVADVDAAWEALSVKIATMELDPEGHFPPKKGLRNRLDRSARARRARRRAMPGRLLVGAAVLAILIGGVWIALTATNGFTGEDTDAIAREIVTERGERAQVRLSDGSHIMLNAESALILPETFGNEERSVELSGEAYFEVASDERPFRVHTEEGQVDVLGTSFNVRAYREEASTRVAVREGRVSLRARSAEENADGVELQAGHLGISEAGQIVLVENRGIAAYMGWTEGRLIFDDMPLSNVALELERWFDTHVVIEDADALEATRLTANIREQPLSEVVQVIAASLDLAYEIREDTVVFRKN